MRNGPGGLVAIVETLDSRAFTRLMCAQAV
jgi:hypothetical protein